MRARLFVVVAILALAVVAAGFKFVHVKQDLAQQRARIDEEWLRVESAMQKRADVVPTMFERLSVAHDAQQLEGIRKTLAAPGAPEAKVQANREISLMLAKLLLACETNPAKRKRSDFRGIREELAAREDEIADARFQYNNALEHYNARMLRFPDNVVASLAGFSRNDAYFGTGPDASLIAPKASK
jgi:LemA protein